MRATPGLCWSDTVPEYLSVAPPVLTEGLPDARPQHDTPQPHQALREPSRLFLPDNETDLLRRLMRPWVRSRTFVERITIYADWLDRGFSKQRAAFEAGIDMRTAHRYSRRLADGERPYPSTLELASWSVPDGGTPSRSVLLRRAAELPDVVICALEDRLDGQDLVPVRFDSSISKQRPWVDLCRCLFRSADCRVAGLTQGFERKYISGEREEADHGRPEEGAGQKVQP